MVTQEQMQRLNRVRKSLTSDRERWDAIWQDIAKYINPYYGSWSEGAPREEAIASMRDIFDNTAMKASTRLADGIQGYACGRTIAWFRLQFEKKQMNDNDVFIEYLQECEKGMYKTLNKSNFYDECRSFIKCGADFGTAVMLREDNRKRQIPCYKTLHPKNVLLMENNFGEVDTLYREFWLSTEDAIDYFGADKLPATIKDCQEPTKMWRFWQYVAANYRFKLDVKGKDPYISIYWADVEQDKPIKEERFAYKPFYAWRWARNYVGEVWGVDAPGMLEISNSKQLNGMRKDKQRLSQLQARPPVKKTEGLIVNFTPGGLTDVRAGQDFAPQQVTGNLSWLENDIITMKKEISETYYADFFLVLTQNIERIKTATEVAGLQDEKSALLASFFGRLATEFLEPMLEDLYASELKYKRLPEVPPGLQDADLAIDFVSPLAMIQKRAHELSTTKAFMAEIIPLAEIQPNVLDKIDLDKYVEVVGDAGSVNKKVLRSDADTTEIRKARAEIMAQQQQQQMQLEQAKVGATVMEKAGKAPEKGSPMANR